MLKWSSLFFIPQPFFEKERVELLSFHAERCDSYNVRKSLFFFDQLSLQVDRSSPLWWYEQINTTSRNLQSRFGSSNNLVKCIKIVRCLGYLLHKPSIGHLLTRSDGELETIYWDWLLTVSPPLPKKTTIILCNELTIIACHIGDSKPIRNYLIRNPIRIRGTQF